jgi:hypothetical protein
MKTDKTKRIALHISGLSRFLEESYENLKEFILKPAEKLGYQVDIFIHTWEMEGLVDDKWGYGGKLGRKEDFKGALKWTTDNKSITKEELLSSITDIVTPTKIVIEKHSDRVPEFNRKIKSLPNPRGNVSPINALSQLYSKYQCHLLQEKYQKDNSILYDFVIKYRTEIRLKRDLITGKILKLASTKIVIPNRKSKFGKFYGSDQQFIIHYKDPGLADIFAIGKPHLMSIYNTSYSRLKYLVKQGRDFNPHHILGRDIRGKYELFDFK